MYQRQEALHLNVPSSATVIGCGGTGWWTALFLAMSGVGQLVLVDDDVIEEHNLNRLPIISGTIGRYKVEVLKKSILSKRPNCIVIDHLNKVDEDNISQLITSATFCCTDNLNSQRLINAYCRRNGIRYQRVGYDGTVLNVSESFPLTFKEEGLENGYEITPSWVAPAAMAGAMGVAAALYKPIVVMDDISKITTVGSSVVPEGVKEVIRDRYHQMIEEEGVSEYFGDYGYCGDCERGNCGDCYRGDCDNCDYYSPDVVAEDYINRDTHNDEIESLENDIAERDDRISELREVIDELTEKLESLREVEA